jgi:hypothetical protein
MSSDKVGVLLACNHTVYRRRPWGGRVALTYKHCREQQVVLRWYVISEEES